MFTVANLGRVCDMLVEDGLMHDGQVKDVMVRYSIQEKRILIDRRGHLRKALGRRRVSYEVGEMEIIASFNFPLPEREKHKLTEHIITECVARHLGLPFFIPDPTKLDYKLVTGTFPGQFAERHLIIPIRKTKKVVTLAVANPFDTELLESLKRYARTGVELVLAPKSEILKTIMEFHGFKKSVDLAAKQVSSELGDLGNLEALAKMKAVDEIDASDQPVIQAVWFLFNYAFDQQASDIHIEPKRETSEVRLRIDGVLHPIHVMPKVVHRAVVSRVKTLARMDIAEHRRPQDGRLKTTFKDSEIELRVSSVPTAFGEKVVVRVFDPDVLTQEIAQLGMFAGEQDQFESFIERTNGLVLVTGPTGSGKTTTLYSTLQYLYSPQVNITTIEDPIEMVREEFNQISVHKRLGISFSSALRNVLRQDPDIVMLGEIRDQETAESAVQAALTGHLVLSTLHTNDTATSVTRMLDLGVLPFLLSSVLVGVIAQRLVRCICENCKVSTLLTHDQIMSLNIPGAEGRELRVGYGAGCVKCRGTGYRGRTGVFELMPVNSHIRNLIQQESAADAIRREALAEGMITIREYAIKKMAMGLTTYEEVVRVTSES